MADGKNIEIKIAATGGEQAAGEFRKVGSAVDTATQDVEELKQELGPVATGLEQVGKNAAKAADDLTKIKNAQVGAALGDATDKISEFAGKIVNIGPDLDAAFGAEAAGKIREVAGTIQEVANAGSAIASGFAVGGPVGGAIAGLGVGLAETGKAWVQMRKDQEGATASAELAAEMQDKLNKLLEDGVESQEGFTAAVLSDEIKDQYERQTEALKGLIAELDAARKVTAAEDKVAAAKRDNEDAAAIRAGANPEDIKTKRSQDDATRAKSRIDYELNLEKTLLREKQKLADEASGGLEKLKADKGSIPEQIKTAEDILGKAMQVAADAERKVAERNALAPFEKEAIDTKSRGRVDDLSADKAERLQKEKAAAEKKAADEKAKQDREAARQANEQLRNERRESGGFSGGRSSRGGRGFDDHPDDEAGRGSQPFRKLSAVEDGHRRAALRAKDREDRAGARQRDREERGGRKPGSLELRDRDDSTSIPKDAVDQFRGDVKRSAGGGESGGGQMSEVLGLMKELSSSLAAGGGGGGGGKDYSGEINQIKRDIQIINKKMKHG